MKTLLIGASGYVGSALYPTLLEHGHDVTACDALWFGGPSGQTIQRRLYQELDRTELAHYDAICLFGAHSNVGMSLNDPMGALKNNLYGPIELVEKLRPDQIFVYASSSSVYSGCKSLLADETMPLYAPQNIYDYTKAAFDNYMLQRRNRRFYGLRFGTVNGHSPSVRWDLIINSMTRNALKDGQILLFNGQVHRPVLATADLIRAIPRIFTTNGAPGLYNLASFNGTVAQIADAVSACTGARIVQRPDTATYDFSISTEKFESEFDFEFVSSPDSIVAELTHLCRTQPPIERSAHAFTSFEQMSGL